jgi:hypothetical protein
LRTRTVVGVNPFPFFKLGFEEGGGNKNEGGGDCSKKLEGGIKK